MKIDAAYCENGRWLTVVSPQDRDGTALLLAPLLDPAKALQAARRESGTPAVSFTTEDCERSCRELVERGVMFVSEPRPMDYGESTPCNRTDAAVMSDEMARTMR
jgi:hypothetical protein